MATPKRPAKSGKSWTFSELDAYNIRIKTVGTQAFFGISDLPAPAVDPVIIQSLDIPRDSNFELPDNILMFFDVLSDAVNNADRALVEVFTRHVLSCIVRFDEPGVMFARPPLPFIMSGRRVQAAPDLSLKRERYYVILVQYDKTSRDRAEPRLVASALGAFSADNDKRTADGLPPILSKRFIGIVTIGVAHYFYKITIAQALSDAVVNSQFPSQETIVERFVPPVPDPDGFLRNGMVPLDNRFVCFQCYEALKTLL